MVQSPLCFQTAPLKVSTNVLSVRLLVDGMVVSLHVKWYCVVRNLKILLKWRQCYCWWIESLVFQIYKKGFLRGDAAHRGKSLAICRKHQQAQEKLSINAKSLWIRDQGESDTDHEKSEDSQSDLVTSFSCLPIFAK